MDLYDKIKKASKLTKELEELKKEYCKLMENNIRIILVGESQKIYVKNLISDKPTDAVNHLKMATEFYEVQLVKYFELCIQDLEKEIESLMHFF